MSLPRLSQSPRAPEFVQNPYPFYDRARALGPLFHWDDYGFACAARFEMGNAILKDRRFGREQPAEFRTPVPEHLIPFYEIEAHSMLEREPPGHTRLRGLVLREFTSRRVANLAPEIETLAQQLIDRFPDEPFDLLKTYAERLPVIVIARLLGLPDAMADQLLDWSHAMVAMYQASRDRAVEDRAVAASLAFTDYLKGIIAERRKRPGEDLLSALIRAHDEGDRLSEAEMITTAILLLNAGHEATVHTLGTGAKAMLEHGISVVTPGLVEEILRFDPPLHMFTRYALEDIEIAGHRFARGDQVGVLLGAAGHDASANPDPARFDAERVKPQHLAFGAGIHFCVGAPLARLELEIGLKVLFDRCPDLTITTPPRYADTYHFHGLERLMVRV